MEIQRNRPRILYLVDALDHDYQSGVTHGVLREAERFNADIMVLVGGKMVFVNRHLERRKFIYDLAKPTDFDGVILLGTSLSSQEGHAAIAPLIIRFASLPTVSIGLDIGKGCAILVNNADGTEKITEHLIETHGHRRFAYISGPENNGEAKTRLKAFQETLERHELSLEPGHLAVGAFTEASGEVAMRELLDQRKIDIAELDAIVAANDSMAVGAMDELGRRGYNVPKDVAVVGFDDIEAARYAETPLSTMQQPLVMLGEQAVQKVLFSEDTPADNIVSVSPKMVIRRSCGCGNEVDAPPVTTGPPADAFDTLHAIVTRKRYRIEGDLATIAESGGITRGWEKGFMDTVIDALGGGEYRLVTDTIADLVRRSITRGEGLYLWAMLLAALEKHLSALVNAGTEHSARVEAIIHRSRVAISEVTEHFHATRIRELRNRTFAFNQAAMEMLSTLDAESLVATFAEHFPKLGINTAAVSLFEKQNPSAAWMTRFLVLDNGKIIKNTEKFPSSNIAPPELVGDRPHAYIVEPLCYDEEILGIAVLEYCTVEGCLYEQVGAFLSAAIKALMSSQSSVRVQQKQDTEMHIDPLTGIYNHIHLKQRLAEELPRAESTRSPISLLMLDMDDFSDLNKELGEAEGDRALLGVVDMIRRCIQPWEILARMEGDVFAVLMPNVKADEAKAKAELIGRRLKLALAFEFHGHISASFGIDTVVPTHLTEPGYLLEAAERALVTAKRKGKDRTVHVEDLRL